MKKIISVIGLLILSALITSCSDNNSLDKSFQSSQINQTVESSDESRLDDNTIEASSFISSEKPASKTSLQSSDKDNISSNQTSGKTKLEIALSKEYIESTNLNSLLLSCRYWVVVQEPSCPQTYHFKADGTMKSNDVSSPNKSENYNWSVDNNTITLVNLSAQSESKYIVYTCIENENSFIKLIPSNLTEIVIWKKDS